MVILVTMESVYNNFEINFRADNFTQQEQQQHTHTKKDILGSRSASAPRLRTN